ncbi:MAG: hypothetical protein M1814_004861 [Vezdaea aestivalis]|nr:MAG: hypothetical protein M1814_004861 [Vezdaea aestivalis]
MVFNTITVGASVTPTVVETYFNHYLNRKPLHQKPTAHISYHEGLKLIRQFLEYASHHTVEDIQGFTSQWVPHARWIKVDEVTIPEENITKGAKLIEAQLGHHSIQTVGGSRWWQWRRHGGALKAEWIEMRTDFNQRKKVGEKSRRIMLYVHGGAYFFGSVDEHRYQIQRHARKLKARVLARYLVLLLTFCRLPNIILARYRLAPQFPFPCGLHDCLSAYLYLLTEQEPSTIILAGDSAGGGMITSMMVILRDQGIPLPAGAILISPWVDLTHSFQSVAGDNSSDYIPAHGFMSKPSASWPPPNSDDMLDIAQEAVGRIGKSMDLSSAHEREAVQGFSIIPHAEIPAAERHTSANGLNDTNSTGTADNTIPGAGHELSIIIEDKLVQIKDQIQMYTTNQLISHPLVSPVLQPSLGGLPPLLILTGGGEVLRDEQIYLAHKAANPTKYPPADVYLDAIPHGREQVSKWKGTDVQLQVWDDCCHVTPTLSFTRPAKFMYRSVAQFGAWALARAQKTEIEIMDDDNVSVISNDSDETDIGKEPGNEASASGLSTIQIGRAGDPLPSFRGHMVRQRVDRHGAIFPLGAPSTLPALNLPANEIGVIKEGPVGKWMAAKKKWDTKYAAEKRKVQKQRVNEMIAGFEGFGDDEAPPPSALAGRRIRNMPKEEKRKRSWGMSLWTIWGSKHDEKTRSLISDANHQIKREEKAEQEPESSVIDPTGAADTKKPGIEHRSPSHQRAVTDEGQALATETASINDENTITAEILLQNDEDPNLLGPTSAVKNKQTHDVKTLASLRPNAGPVAFPFKLAPPDRQAANASTLTLTSEAGVATVVPATKLSLPK